MIAQAHGLFVPDLACQRDRFGDDIIRRQQAIGEPKISERPEDFDDARMMSVPLRDERKEESRVEKDHTFGRP